QKRPIYHDFFAAFCDVVLRLAQFDPLCPRKRTNSRPVGVVRFVPKADIRTAADLLIQSPRRRGRAASGARQLRGSQAQYSRRGGSRAHLIIAHDVTNSGSDRAQLATMSFIVLPLPPRRAAVAGSRAYRKWRGAAPLRGR